MFITLTRWSMERMPVKRALGGFAAALVMLGLPSVASAQTAPTLSDTWQGAVTAEANVHYVHGDTSGFTAAGEPHSAGNGSCFAGNGAGPGTVNMEDTFWLKVEGTGGPITLSTVGSNFDTIVAVYPANQAPAIGTAFLCRDDDRGDDVELKFNSQAGATYYTQWGGCAGCAGGSFGRAEFTILTNDMREFAAPAITRTRANWSATTAPGETVTCGPTQYGRTVWFRYVATAPGTVTFAASRFDTVSALYRGNATTPFDCNDNDQGNILRSAVSGYVLPGEVLYLQVGGRDNGTGGFEDNFSLDVTFAEDQDIDNDGYNKRPGPDCDDNDPSVHPQQIETPNNGKDDDCAGGDSHDTDLDGQDAEPYGPDCDDGNDAIFKGAAEIRGNFVDENCDDKTPAAQLSPFPAVSYSHVAVLAGRQFGVLKVTSVAKGYRIAVRCRGSSRCPKKFTKKTKSRRAVTTNRYKRTFGPGAEVEIRVTKPGVNRYGYFVEYKVVAPRDVVKRTCKIQPKSGRLTGCRRA